MLAHIPLSARRAVTNSVSLEEIHIKLVVTIFFGDLGTYHLVAAKQMIRHETNITPNILNGKYPRTRTSKIIICTPDAYITSSSAQHLIQISDDTDGVEQVFGEANYKRLIFCITKTRKESS